MFHWIDILIHKTQWLHRNTCLVMNDNKRLSSSAWNQWEHGYWSIAEKLYEIICLVLRYYSCNFISHGNTPSVTVIDIFSIYFDRHTKVRIHSFDYRSTCILKQLQRLFKMEVAWKCYTWVVLNPGVCITDNFPCKRLLMMTSSNGNIFRVTGLLWGEFTGDRWIPLTKANDAELWCFLWAALEWTVE